MARSMISVVVLTPWNGARGQMAEAFLRAYGGTDMNVISCGTSPSGLVRPEAVQVMYERGLGIPAGQLPKLLLREYIDVADYIIFMGNLAKAALPKDPKARVLEWKVEDPLGTELDRWRRVRDDIEAKVKEFLQQVGISVAEAVPRR